MTATAQEPLWSDAKIEDATRLPSLSPSAQTIMLGALLSMRLDYEAKLDEYQARIQELEAQLAEARKWVPPTDYQTGGVTYVAGVLSTLIETVNAAGEDEAWEHLQSEADDE